MGGKDIFLVHKPEDFNHKCSVNFVGHVHEKWKVMKKNNVLLINVGVDVWDFRPVSFQKLYNLIQES